MLDLAEYFFGVLRTVQLEEDFADHGLLILGKLADTGLVDVPVVVHLGAKGVVEWIVTPNTEQDWRYEPVIQVSQLGYAPTQPKRAVIETASGRGVKMA